MSFTHRRVHYLLASVAAISAWSPAQAQSINADPGPAPLTPQAAGANAQDLPAPSQAEAANPAATVGDIIVTARRRSETTLQTPVVVTAFSGEQLSRAGITNIADIGKLTPQLVIAPNVGPYGGSLTLRGVASPTSNASAEPAVTVNIDGVPISFGGVVRLGQLDTQQIEILKGPQALFFGKNSSGGIIAIKSGDPTKDFRSSLSVGHEFNAEQVDIDGFVSGPVTDTLSARLAGRYSYQQGYFRNLAPDASRYAPGTGERAVRGSLTWEPFDRLTIRAKGTYDDIDDGGPYASNQLISCPLGRPQSAYANFSLEDCRANNTTVRGNLPANIAALTNNTLFGNGVPYLTVKQRLGVIDATWKPFDGISLNSITGFYRLHQRYAENPTAEPNPPSFGTAGDVRKDTFSQEVRLSSDTEDSRLTWMIGGFYQDDDFKLDEQYVRQTSPGVFTPFPRVQFRIASKAYSAFGQAGIDLIDHVNLSGGIRYSKDDREQTVAQSGKFVKNLSFDDWSPEVTLSYKPHSDLNIFASYKEGYKAGNFQVGSLNFASLISNPAITNINNVYQPERVSGFEGGVKAALLGRQLRVNFAVYHYKYVDLQLSQFDSTQFVTRITNASTAKVRGAEADFNFAPDNIAGLRVFGAVAFNRATYGTFQSACYVGQTIAQGCTIDGPDAGTVPDLQNLTGRPLPRAPKWAGNLGFSYDRDVGSDLRFGFNAMGNFSSASFISQEETPFGVTPKRVLLDAGAHIGSASGSWDLALIGRNLTNRYYGQTGFQQSATGNPATTGTTAGVPADFYSVVSRGREIWLRFTIKPNLF